jgi:peroxiredoxin
MPDSSKKEHSLKDFLGKKTVLAFFPGVFTTTCTKEMNHFKDSLSSLHKGNVNVVGISVDPPFALKAFAEKYGLNFPLLSDYTREVSKRYMGVYNDFSGLRGYSASKRAVVVLDEHGKVVYAWSNDNPAPEPPYEEIDRALAKK